MTELQTVYRVVDMAGDLSIESGTPVRLTASFAVFADRELVTEYSIQIPRSRYDAMAKSPEEAIQIELERVQRKMDDLETYRNSLMDLEEETS